MIWIQAHSLTMASLTACVTGMCCVEYKANLWNSRQQPRKAASKGTCYFFDARLLVNWRPKEILEAPGLMRRVPHDHYWHSHPTWEMAGQRNSLPSLKPTSRLCTRSSHMYCLSKRGNKADFMRRHHPCPSSFFRDLSCMIPSISRVFTPMHPW